MKKLQCLILCMLVFAFVLSAAGALADTTEADYAITLTADATTVMAGQKVTLTAAFADPEKVNKKAKNDTITWTLTDENGQKTKDASINAKGVVTTQKSIKKKTVVVATATAKSMPSQTASVKITIIPCVSKISVQAETDTLYLEDGYNTVQLTAAVEPADANKNITWKSSDEKVATVDQNGLVTAVAGGKATITATAGDGTKVSGNVKLTVGIPVGTLNGLTRNGSACLQAGKGSLTFSVNGFCDKTGNPVTPTNKNITWSLKVRPESAQPYVSIDKKGKLTAAKDCPPAVVDVTAAADGSLLADSATYTMNDILIAPAAAAATVKAGSADDFYGTWNVFMTVDAKGKASSADSWMMKHNIWIMMEFEIIEYNGKPLARITVDFQSEGEVSLYLKDGALYKDDGNGQGDRKLFELCADGTMIQYVITSTKEPDTRLYCIRTSDEKRTINTPAASEGKAEQYLLSDLGTQDINGNSVDSSLIADKQLVMVNVWATYCQPCINEMEGLGNLSRELADRGVLIVGVVCDCQDPDFRANEKKLEEAREIVGTTGADYPHLLPSWSMYEGFVDRIQVIPTTFFVDSSGRKVGETYVGSRDEAEWRQIILDTLPALEEERATTEEEQAYPAEAPDMKVIPEAVTKETGGIPDSIDQLAGLYDLELMKKLYDLRFADILDTLAEKGSCSFPSLDGEWPFEWSWITFGSEGGYVELSGDTMRVADGQVTITLDEASAKGLAESALRYMHIEYAPGIYIIVNKDPDRTGTDKNSMVYCSRECSVGDCDYSYTLFNYGGSWSIRIECYQDGKSLGGWFAEYGSDGAMEESGRILPSD